MRRSEPTARSRLLLTEVDEILKPFFFGSSLPSPTAEVAATPSAGRLDEDASNHPLNETDKLEHQRQATLNARGQSHPIVAGKGVGGGIASSQHGRASASSHGSSPVAVNDHDESRRHQPGKPILHAVQEEKRKRFMGAMVELLEEPSVCSEAVVVGAEHKVGHAAAPQKDANDNNHVRR